MLDGLLLMNKKGSARASFIYPAFRASYITVAVIDRHDHTQSAERGCLSSYANIRAQFMLVSRYADVEH
jgi:hypothetical protein